MQDRLPLQPRLHFNRILLTYLRLRIRESLSRPRRKETPSSISRHFATEARHWDCSLFTAVWTVIVYFLWNSHAPWFFAAVFGFFDLIMIYGCIQSAFGSTRIIVGHGKVISLRKIFGPGKPRVFAFSEIQAVLVAAGTPAREERLVSLCA